MLQKVRPQSKVSRPKGRQDTGRRRPKTSADAYAAAKLRQYRCALDISQDSLGKSLDITYQQIQKYESVRNVMSVGTLAAVARILDIPPSLFFSDDADADAAALNDLHITRQAMKFIGLFTSIRDGNDRSALLHLAEKMSKCRV